MLPLMSHNNPATYALIPRHTRTLPRGAHVTSTTSIAIKVDSGVESYFRFQPPPIAQRPTGQPHPFHLPWEITAQILSMFRELDAAVSRLDPEYRLSCSLCYLSNLYNLALISRSWNGPATELLYETLKLSLDDLCAYHHRGIPWRDGLFWFARRNTYLRERYLKPLLRTLQARPDLAGMFRVLEVDLHSHLSSDFSNLSLWAKVLAHTTGLVRVRGDPCIFFAAYEPYLESVARDMVNYVSRGSLYRGQAAAVVRRQRRVWEVLAGHKGWEQWVWSAGCMDVGPESFRRFHMGWQALRNLEIRGLWKCGEGGAEAIAVLGALEEVKLSRCGMKVLEMIPMGKLKTLSVEVAMDSKKGSLTAEMEALWSWLKADRAVSGGSKMVSFSIKTRAYHAWIMESWLPNTLSHLPNISSLSVSLHHKGTPGVVIILSGESSITEMPVWTAPFPSGRKLSKIEFFCPGWSHNRYLLQVLQTVGVWPELEEVQYCKSTALAEPFTAVFDPAASRRKGAAVEEEMREELRRRGLAVVGVHGGEREGSARGGLPVGLGNWEGAVFGRVVMKRVGWV